MYKSAAVRTTYALGWWLVVGGRLCGDRGGRVGLTDMSREKDGLTCDRAGVCNHEAD